MAETIEGPVGKLVLLERVDSKALGDDAREANRGILTDMDGAGVMLVDPGSGTTIFVPYGAIRTIQIDQAGG